jgi:regulator of sirC expression with transglutaminase-like and TPR domain
VEQTRRAFAELVAPGGGELDGHLDQGAFLIASAIDPSLVMSDQLARLDQIAASMNASNGAELALALFGGVEHDPMVHFSGNDGQYYDTENSLLHRVLDRRIGIPITLAVLLIEVGRRRGISLHGVGMPGHFLVGSAHGFIDTFHGGVLLDVHACHQLFRRLAGQNATLPEGSLDRTPHAFILKRMLFNLSAIGANQQQRRN